MLLCILLIQKIPAIQKIWGSYVILNVMQMIQLLEERVRVKIKNIQNEGLFSYIFKVVYFDLQNSNPMSIFVTFVESALSRKPQFIWKNRFFQIRPMDSWRMSDYNYSDTVAGFPWCRLRACNRAMGLAHCSSTNSTLTLHFVPQLPCCSQSALHCYRAPLPKASLWSGKMNELHLFCSKFAG